MLENRAFDHLLGFSGLTGFDAADGSPTRIEGLTGSESNPFGGTTYPVSRGADFALKADPGHEFHNVLDQLCGPEASYTAPYPPIVGSGFVDSWVRSGGKRPGTIMKCFDTPAQLPVLHALAQSYAVCDHWYSAIPGPTVPNRMFVHAASSAGLDHSPTHAELVWWESVQGVEIPTGTLFDALGKAGKRYRLYSGDQFPLVASLPGIHLTDIESIDTLVEELKDGAFPYQYVFIEPSYYALDSFRKSSSQHPLADVRDGERLVKKVYEAVRGSPHWEDALLVITWDEHGGFYDHVPPPRATPPGPGTTNASYSKHGFTFEQYGVRVPAIVISPNIRRNTIDHRPYSHASIPATLEKLFGLSSLTGRDRDARDLLDLASGPLPDAVADHPMRLPPAGSASRRRTIPLPTGPVDDGVLPSFIHTALHQQILADPANKGVHLKRVANLKNRGEAIAYLREAAPQLASLRGVPRAVR